MLTTVSHAIVRLTGLGGARFKPRFVAFLGVTSFRTAFGKKGANVGRQPEPIADAAAWLLPNPSGLNAHYQADDLARVFGELRQAVANT